MIYLEVNITKIIIIFYKLPNSNNNSFTKNTTISNIKINI